MTISNDTVIKTIDELGILRAQKAELERQEKVLKDRLGDLAPGAYEGEVFRLTISNTEREKFDVAAAKAKLSPQFVRAHTTYDTVRTLRTTSRTGKGLAA